MTTSEEQIVLEDGSEEVAIPVANYKTLTQGISYDSDVRDSSRYLQIGYHANNNSLLSISFTTPNKMKNALIRSADLELNQIYALCAETGSRIDLYQVPAANTDNFIKDSFIAELTDIDLGLMLSIDVKNYRSFILARKIEHRME